MVGWGTATVTLTGYRYMVGWEIISLSPSPVTVTGTCWLGGLPTVTASPVTDTVTITVYKYMYMVGMTDTWLVGGGLQVSQPQCNHGNSYMYMQNSQLSLSALTPMTDTWPPTVTVIITSDTDDRYMAGWS